MGFNLIYWIPICGKNLLDCSILEKCGKIWKNGRFSGRLRPDWGHTARAATAGLGSKGELRPKSFIYGCKSLQHCKFPAVLSICCTHGVAELLSFSI